MTHTPQQVGRTVRVSRRPNPTGGAVATSIGDRPARSTHAFRLSCIAPQPPWRNARWLRKGRPSYATGPNGGEVFGLLTFDLETRR